MKKLNYPLIIGAIMVFFLTVASIYPEIFTPSDPYGEERAKFVFIDGKITLFSPPVKPSPEYPWGTDVYGRDMRSLIFYGCKLTVYSGIFVAVGRIIIALPLALLAGYKNKAASWLIKQWNMLFSAFPLIILVLLLTNLKLVTDYIKQTSMIVSVLLIVFGWSKLASLLKEKIEEVLDQDFIEGEIAIGKNKLEIALHNIMPHIVPSIIVLFFLEIASVLLILSQIGVFGVIFNGGMTNSEGDYILPYEVDWASLLVGAPYNLMVGKLWLVLYPALAFSFSIIGFNLLGEGLRMEFGKRDSRIITWIRRIPNFLSPLRLVYEIRHFEANRRSVYARIIFYLAVLLLIFFPHTPSLYHFNSINAFNTMKEMTRPEYNGRKAGTGINEKLAAYVESRLKEYGVKPFDGKYVQPFKLENAFDIAHSSLTVMSDTSGVLELKPRKDYYVNTPVPIDGEYDLVKLSIDDLGGIPYVDMRKFRQYRDKVILMDLRGVPDIPFASYTGMLNNYIKPKAFIYIRDWKSEKEPKKPYIDYPVTRDNSVPNINVASDVGDELLRKAGNKVRLQVSCMQYKNPEGYNVVGYIPGSDPALKDEVIVVGCTYDGVGNDAETAFPAAMEAGGASIGLEAARVIGNSAVKPKRTVVFAFWDAENTRDKGTHDFLNKYFKEEGQKVFYIDLRNFGSVKAKEIMLDTSHILPKDVLMQKYVRQIKKNARRNEVKLDYGKIGSLTTFDFVNSDINTLIIDSSNIEDDIKTPLDNIGNIDRGKLEKPGQMIVDSIYDIVCRGIK